MAVGELNDLVEEEVRALIFVEHQELEKGTGGGSPSGRVIFIEARGFVGNLLASLLVRFSPPKSLSPTTQSSVCAYMRRRGLINITSSNRRKGEGN